MGRIFVSYRRDDTQGEASHLAADLRRRYGEPAVFMDLATIGPGEEFAQSIEHALRDSSVVLVLIGRRWMALAEGQGRHRLDDPDDWVRRELTVALSRRMRVVPVLVQGATLPAAEALPEALRRLLRHNAHELTANRWDYDFAQLAAVLDRDVAPVANGRGQQGLRWWRRGAAAASVAVAGLAWWTWPSAPTGAPSSVTAAPMAGLQSPMDAGTQQKILSMQDAAEQSNVADFLELTSSLAKQPDLSDDDLNRVAAAEETACRLTLKPGDSPCKKALGAAVSTMMDEVCKRKAGPVPAKAGELGQLAFDIHELGLTQCLGRYSFIQGQRKHERALRAIKPG